MGYIMIPLFIENFLPNQVLNILHSYCIMKYSNKTNFEVDSQTSSLISEHSDPLMETILDLTTPVVEQNLNKKLYPTYSFLRIYDKGSDLPIHKDRPSCEYTVALCLGSDPAEKPYEIFVGEVDETSDYKYFDSKGNFNKYKINYKYPMKPNNALIFKGMDNIHWREICEHDHFITVFLHYVDQEGEFKEYKYDKRSMLGVISS